MKSKQAIQHQQKGDMVRVDILLLLLRSTNLVAIVLFVVVCLSVGIPVGCCCSRLLNAIPLSNPSPRPLFRSLVFIYL